MVGDPFVAKRDSSLFLFGTGILTGGRRGGTAISPIENTSFAQPIADGYCTGVVCSDGRSIVVVICLWCCG